MDIGKALKAKQMWDTFGKNHPKFQAFLNAVYSRGLTEGTVIEISVKYPDGSSMKSNIMVNRDDTEMLGMIKR